MYIDSESSFAYTLYLLMDSYILYDVILISISVFHVLFYTFFQQYWLHQVLLVYLLYLTMSVYMYMLSTRLTVRFLYYCLKFEFNLQAVGFCLS